MFFNAYVLYTMRLFKLKTEGQTINFKESYKTEIKILADLELV